MVSVTIRINDEEKQQIAAIAKEQDLSMSQAIRRAIREYIAEYNQVKSDSQ